jgi:hypothetical protein
MVTDSKKLHEWFCREGFLIEKDSGKGCTYSWIVTVQYQSIKQKRLHFSKYL